MLLARGLDDCLSKLYRAGAIPGGVFLGRGQEALSAAVGLSLQQGDLFAPLIRDAAGRLAFGETVEDSLRSHLGSVLGPMKGRDGNIHRGRLEGGLLPMISHLGAMISVVNGWLMAHRFQGMARRVGVATAGDGATSTGSLHEGLNQAAVERLPLVLVVADNQFAYSTPNQRQYACASLLERAKGYGVSGWEVDGTDFEDCLDTVRKAVECARSGAGPQLVVGTLLRLCGHGEHDPGDYIHEHLRLSEVGRDCLEVAREKLAREGLADEADFEAWQVEVEQQIQAALEQVRSEPSPDPDLEEWSALSTRVSSHPAQAHQEVKGS